MLMDGVEKAITGPDGSYALRSVSSGVHKVEAQKQGLHFTSEQFGESRESAVADLVVTHYDICGSVAVELFAVFPDMPTQFTVSLEREPSFKKAITVDKDFCFTVRGAGKGGVGGRQGRHMTSPTVASPWLCGVVRLSSGAHC